MIQADAVISANQDTIQTLETQEDKAQENRNDLQNHIVKLIESKLPTTYEGPDIDVLAQQETKLVDKIETLQTDIETAEQEISEFKQRNAELKLLMQSRYNLKEIQTNIETHNNLLEAHNEISMQIKTQQGVIDAKEQKIKHLDAHEYDTNCKYCTSNVFVQDAIEAQDTIDSDRAILTELERRFDALETDIEAVSIYQVQRDELTYYSQTYKVTATDIERKELRLQLLESELQTRESELETCLERQESFTKNETAIKHNRRIDLKIGLCKDDIEMYTEDIKEIQSQIKSLFGAIEVAKTNRGTALRNLESYQQLETEYKAYEYYLAAVQRNGIPYELVAKALPKIEAEINNVLNQIVDFNMVMNSDGKNINGYIIYDEDNFWPLELTSGMERFVSSLAIRIALINVSALPRPNFIAIDEGWGSLDAEHISSVVNLFEYFKTKFDFSIIISHVDSMRDMVDNLIEVNKTNGFSEIHHS